MFSLAFDTTSQRLSIALLQDSQLLAKHTVEESGKQSELLITEIEKILRTHQIWYQDLGLIATSNGPGSFTGTRIGLIAARTIKIATNLPLVLVNSCEAMAFKYRHIDGKIFVALDAAMNEVFCAEFLCKNNNITQMTDPCVVAISNLSEILPQDNFFLCGSAKKLITINARMSEEEDVLEADLIAFSALEKFKNAGESKNFDPLYLRNPRIEKRKK